MAALNFFIQQGCIELDVEKDVEPVVMTSTCVRSFDLFEQVSLAQVKDIIICLKPTSGGFYVVPLHLLKEIWDAVGASITSIINCSLYNGVGPLGLK